MSLHQAPACRGSVGLHIAAASVVLSLIAFGSGLACAAEPLEIGSEVPPLALPALQRETQRLDALHDRVVVVHFFATWCEPCRQEMAGLSRLAARMRDRPFALLAVDVGEPELRVRRFFEAAPVPFPVLLDEDRAAMKAWGVTMLPSSLVLDRAHRLRLSAGGPVDWDAPAAAGLIDILENPASVPMDGTLPPLDE